MKDKTYYFPHDYGARNDPKLQGILVEHGAAGIGAFWCIIEQLYEQGGAMPLKSCKSIAFALHIDCKVVESIVNDFGLFGNDGETFWSESVNKRMAKRTAITEKRKAAAASRWQSLPDMQMQSESIANVVQPESKIKEKKEKETSSNDDGNGAKPQSRFVPPTLEQVKAYILEKGYSMDGERFIDFYESKGWMVGKNKMKDWKAAVRNWAREESQRPTARKPQTSKSRNVNDEWQ
ncbi:MAG: DUF4373 domain-containing protein [Ruminococcus sp.]|nr:DUF4373 domain-containing protein [Ruminococcus sp.]